MNRGRYKYTHTLTADRHTDKLRVIEHKMFPNAFPISSFFPEPSVNPYAIEISSLLNITFTLSKN